MRGNRPQHVQHHVLRTVAALCLFHAGHGASGANLTSLVEPMIGTYNDGNTFPGASMPFGMVQLSPDTGHNVGYDYIQRRIRGFSHQHISGLPHNPDPNPTSTSSQGSDAPWAGSSHSYRSWVNHQLPRIMSNMRRGSRTRTLTTTLILTLTLNIGRG